MAMEPLEALLAGAQLGQSIRQAKDNREMAIEQQKQQSKMMKQTLRLRDLEGSVALSDLEIRQAENRLRREELEIQRLNAAAGREATVAGTAQTRATTRAITTETGQKIRSFETPDAKEAREARKYGTLEEWKRESTRMAEEDRLSADITRMKAAEKIKGGKPKSEAAIAAELDRKARSVKSAFDIEFRAMQKMAGENLRLRRDAEGKRAFDEDDLNTPAAKAAQEHLSNAQFYEAQAENAGSLEEQEQFQKESIVQIHKAQAMVLANEDQQKSKEQIDYVTAVEKLVTKDVPLAALETVLSLKDRFTRGFYGEGETYPGGVAPEPRDDAAAVKAFIKAKLKGTPAYQYWERIVSGEALTSTTPRE